MIEFVTNPAFAQAFYNSSPGTARIASPSCTDFAADLASALQKTPSSKTSEKTMDEIFSQASCAYAVPETLLRSIAFHESRYQPEVISRCGAMGVMQLMPDTAKAMGVADPFDAEQNIMGAAKLLGQLINKYDGDLKLTLAAYGAGSGSVAKYKGVPPFAETQNFVRDIMSVVDKNASIPSSSSPASPPASSTIAEGIRNFKSYTPEDYRLFLLMLLDATSDAKSEEGHLY